MRLISLSVKMGQWLHIAYLSYTRFWAHRYRSSLNSYRSEECEVAEKIEARFVRNVLLPLLVHFGDKQKKANGLFHHAYIS
jgi:hypothetical protein